MCLESLPTARITSNSSCFANFEVVAEVLVWGSVDTSMVKPIYTFAVALLSSSSSAWGLNCGHSIIVVRQTDKSSAHSVCFCICLGFTFPFHYFHSFLDCLHVNWSTNSIIVSKSKEIKIKLFIYDTQNAPLINLNTVWYRSYMLRRHLRHYQGVLNQDLKLTKYNRLQK
jgi:hypothetical protein